MNPNKAILRWLSELNALLTKGIVTKQIYDVIVGLKVEDYDYHPFANQARDFVQAKYPKMAFRPDTETLVSALAFSTLLSKYMYFAEAQAMSTKVFDYFKWVEESYMDGENPFPFTNVTDAYFKRLNNKERADLFGELFDAFEPSDVDK